MAHIGPGQEAVYWPWLAEGLKAVTQPFGKNGETGVDFGIPMGRPITNLADGIVLGAGFYGGGGVVSIKSKVNGQAASVYYQHLDDIAPGIAPGAQVKARDLLGWSGGQLQGGHHPSSPKFSTGDHIEVGINAPFGGMWHPLGPNYDPLPWLRRLNAQNMPDDGTAGTSPTSVNGQVHAAIAGSESWLQVVQAADKAEQFKGFDPLHPAASVLLNLEAFAFRGIIVGIGVVILMAVAVNIIKASVEAAAPAAGVAMQLAAPIAAAAA